MVYANDGINLPSGSGRRTGPCLSLPSRQPGLLYPPVPSPLDVIRTLCAAALWAMRRTTGTFLLAGVSRQDGNHNDVTEQIVLSVELPTSDLQLWWIMGCPRVFSNLQPNPS